MDTLNQGIVAQDETITEMRRPSRASTSTVHPGMATQLNPNLPPPVKNPQIPDLQKMLA